MFIKIKFFSMIFIVPQCGGGPVTSVQEIKIVNSLPKETSKNNPVNAFWLVEKEDEKTGKQSLIKRPIDMLLLDKLTSDEAPDDEKEIRKFGAQDEIFERNSDAKMTFEYYYDCGKLNQKEVENLIKLLKYEYQKKADGLGLGYGGGYEFKNFSKTCPIIKDLDKFMKRFEHPNARFFKLMEKMDSLPLAEEKESFLDKAARMICS